MIKPTLRRFLSPLLILLPLVPPLGGATLVIAQDLQTPETPSIVHNIRGSNEQMQMTVNTSRIVKLGQKIPQAQVNNPDILELTALSPTEIQISAQTPGVTQVNLWGEDGKVYTINVIVLGDAQELTTLLRTQFPNASLKVVPLSSGVLISGYVDQPQHIDVIVRIAEEYYPRVLNNITVSGVQQVLLHVKVMEVSRTKLRRVGFDWTQISDQNAILSGVAGLISNIEPSKTSMDPATGFISQEPITATLGGSPTFRFNVVNGDNAFFGVLEALRQDNMLKILAEPTLVTVSGRPATFNVGGETPVLEPQSLGTVSISYKNFGTQVDFVPIVLGNGRIRLEVRPRVSEIDTSAGISMNGVVVPGFRVRQVDTGVEMQAGQTLAIAGLVQNRTEAANIGLPWISEVPYLGAMFRKVEERNNEVELLIMVTPELVDAMDAHEVPACGPGMRTTSPSDFELYFQGHLEVPNCCPDSSCDQCPAGGDMQSPTPFEQMTPGERRMLEPPATPPQPVPESVMRPHNRHIPASRPNSRAASRLGTENVPSGFIGPVGYDLVK